MARRKPPTRLSLDQQNPTGYTFDNNVVTDIDKAFLAADLKEYFEKHPISDWKHDTFKDLAIGDKYIGFPLPGDNRAQGGFQGAHILYEKIAEKGRYNTQRLENRKKIHHTGMIPVIKVR